MKDSILLFVSCVLGLWLMDVPDHSNLAEFIKHAAGLGLVIFSARNTA